MTYENERPNISAEIRRLVMTEAGHRCIVERCYEHIVEIHHIDENRENNSPDNLAVLCDKHHKLAHQKFITRMELRRYKELLSNRVAPHTASVSEHDRKVLKEINEMFSYETILTIQNEKFGRFVSDKVIRPFDVLFYREADPLFRFTDNNLERLKMDLIKNAHAFIRHFSQRSGGVEGGYEYIDINEIERTNPEMVDYWIRYASMTFDLAQDFCKSMFALRSELVNYA